jgi:hypothetical protein
MIGVSIVLTLHKTTLSGSAIIFIECVCSMGSQNNEVMAIIAGMLVSTQQNFIPRANLSLLS